MHLVGSDVWGLNVAGIGRKETLKIFFKHLVEQIRSSIITLEIYMISVVIKSHFSLIIEKTTQIIFKLWFCM